MITAINGKAVIDSGETDTEALLSLREDLCLLMWQIASSNCSSINAVDSLAKIIYIMGNDVK